MLAPADAAALFERHRPALLRFLYRSVRDHHEAEDLVQEVFARAIAGQSEYVDAGRGAAWVFRIARNLLIDRSRVEHRTPTVSSLEDATGSEAQRVPLCRPPLQQLSVEIGQALTALPDPEREAFLLREAGGLGYDDIAALTGGTADAVRSRIYRARAALRTALSPSLDRARPRLLER